MTILELWTEITSVKIVRSFSAATYDCEIMSPKNYSKNRELQE